MGFSITADDKELFGAIFDFYNGIVEDSFKERLISARVVSVYNFQTPPATVEFLFDGHDSKSYRSCDQLLPSDHTIKEIKLGNDGLFIKCMVKGVPFTAIYRVNLPADIRIQAK